MMTLVKADGKREYALLERLAARNGETDRKVTAAVAAPTMRCHSFCPATISMRPHV